MMWSRNHLLQLALFALHVTSVCPANSADALARLYTDLLTDYVPIQPRQAGNEPLLITLDFTPFQIKQLDGKNEILSTFGQIVMTWTDPDLTWTPSDYEGNIAIELSIKDIWRPLIGLRNSANVIYDSDWPSMVPVYVFFTGSVTWAPAGSFETSCDLDMSRFPYDTQECSLNWGAMVTPVDSVNVTYGYPQSDLSFYQGSKEFDLTATWNIRSEATLQGSQDEMFSLAYVQFWLRLDRKPNYYILNIIAPTLVLAILSSFTFKVPVEAGEKISLIVTIVLSYTVFSLILSDLTPQTSDHTPLLVIYMTLSICVGGLSMLFTLIPLHLYHRNPVTPLPGWMRRIIIRGLGPHLLCNKPQKVCVTENEVDVMTADLDNNQEKKTTDMPLHPKEEESNTVDSILREVQKMTRKMAEDAEEETLRAEWMLAAKITDKLLFYIFISIQMFLLLIFFVAMPYA